MQNILEHTKKIISEFGLYPYDFFRILSESETPHLDIHLENDQWKHIKDEEWHDLEMSEYVLWATSDNCDLIWWNGERVVAMNPRSFEFMSLKIKPLNFMKEIPRGSITGIFPQDLWSKNA